MKRTNILYFSLMLVFFIPLIVTVQMEEKARLQEIEQELMELEHKLGDELHPEDRRRFQQKIEELHTEKRRLEEFLYNAGGKKEHNNEHPGGNGLSPTIIAAIIGALGVIIAAIIGLMKEKSFNMGSDLYI